MVMTNPLRYLRNVLTGRYRHWNTEHVPLVATLRQRVRELPPFERSVLLGAVVASTLLVNQLLGPDAGKRRLLRADARRLTQQEFWHIYFLLMSAFLAIFLHKADLFESRLAFEIALAHLFHHDPTGDEFYCRFSEKLKDAGNPSAAFFYQYGEISRFAGEPRPSLASDLERPMLFITAMGSGIETMFKLIERETKATTCETLSTPSR